LASANGDERIYFRANIDGRGKMTSPEATVILGAAVIDDVMGLFVLAFLPLRSPAQREKPLGLQQPGASGCNKNSRPPRVTFARTNGRDQHLRDRVLRRWIRRGKALAGPNDSPAAQAHCQRSCSELHSGAGIGLRHFGRVLGSVAGITGAYLLGYVFAESKYKADVERSFYASATAC